MIIFGLETCPICQKAQKALLAADKDFIFRDIRAEPLDASDWAKLIAEFGDRLVDKKSNDWRGLSDWLKHSEAEEQLAAKPRLMVRPVIVDGDNFYLGWDEEICTALT